MNLRRRSTSRFLVLGMVVPALLGCQAGPAPNPPPSPDTQTVTTKVSPAASAPKAASPDDAIKRVLAISVDGLNPRAIRKLGPSGAPTFHRLMREGAWTFNARTERESTSTLPNHTGMLTSRRVDDRRGGHGVTFNHDNGKTVHRAAGRYVSSVFDVVHDRGGSTALFTAKTKFRFFQRTWNANGARDRVGVDNGRAKIDRVTVDENDNRLVAAVNAELRRSPRQFTFVHIALPDEAGHQHGFMSRQYIAAVQQTDRLLGSMVKSITDRPALRRQMLVVLTSDHGGNGSSHSGVTTLQNHRIPFMVWGPGVAAGKNLHSLNKSFRSPGDSRSSYSGKQPVRNGDLANLVTDVLDLPKVPGSELNAQRRLNVFRR
jgi:predicted AlkP superfamily pyrophosphatase or phosphodiesterase